MEEVRYIQNLEVIDLINFINKKKKLHQKLMLDALESVLDKDSEEFKVVRKAILDNTSDFSRSIIRSIFGDSFEGLLR